MDKSPSETLLIGSLNDLDRLVAQRVMGWKEMDWSNPVLQPGEIRIHEQFDGWTLAGNFTDGTIWSPSRVMDSAWTVAEKLYQSHEFTLERGWIKHPKPAWHCHMGFYDATADTPTLAICVASLLVVGVLVKPSTSLKVSWKSWLMGDAIA